MKFCKTCGSQLPDDAFFCTNCDASFGEEIENTTVLDDDLSQTTAMSEEIGEGTQLLDEKEEVFTNKISANEKSAYDNKSNLMRKRIILQKY